MKIEPKRIDIYCGTTAESWSPKSIDQGIGGSEEMVINLAKELSKNNKVTVWNRCSTDEGEYDGVTYINYEDFDVKETDILIVWRIPQMLLTHDLQKVKARKFLWLHDTVNPLDVLPYCLGFEKILTLSEYHRDYYEGFCPPELRDKFIVTRNAVDYSLFDQKVERDPYTMVYGSNYSRGLQELLQLWPKIKLSVPEAKLRIFYGWQLHEKSMSKEEFESYKEQMEELMNQEGITHLGRISHKECAKEMLGAGIWAYPCIQFNEVSCITAMKAQIGGAIPVVIPKAALNETVKYGVKVRSGDNAGEILNKWADTLIRTLQDVEGQEQVRKVMQKGVENCFDYKSLAEDWQERILNDK